MLAPPSRGHVCCNDGLSVCLLVSVSMPIFETKYYIFNIMPNTLWIFFFSYHLPTQELRPCSCKHRGHTPENSYTWTDNHYRCIYCVNTKRKLVYSMCDHSSPGRRASTRANSVASKMAGTAVANQVLTCGERPTLQCGPRPRL